MLQVVGFGSTEDNKPSDVLRSAFTMVQNDTTCIDYSPKLYRSLLNEFTFCAGFGPTSGKYYEKIDCTFIVRRLFYRHIPLRNSLWAPNRGVLQGNVLVPFLF